MNFIKRLKDLFIKRQKFIREIETYEHVSHMYPDESGITVTYISKIYVEPDKETSGDVHFYFRTKSGKDYRFYLRYIDANFKHKVSMIIHPKVLCVIDFVNYHDDSLYEDIQNFMHILWPNLHNKGCFIRMFSDEDFNNMQKNILSILIKIGLEE